MEYTVTNGQARFKLDGHTYTIGLGDMDATPKDLRRVADMLLIAPDLYAALDALLGLVEDGIVCPNCDTDMADNKHESECAVQLTQQTLAKARGF